MKCALDFETYYDSQYGLKEMSAARYCSDPRFNAYCVSFAREDGRRFVGNPREFDWGLVRGCECFMHNASFDGLVLRRLQQDGIAPRDLNLTMYCTADMAAYFGSFRNLQAAAQNFLGKILQKDTRDKMKGKTLENCGPELREELLRYAQQDADTTLELGLKLFPQWPEVEREASRIGREKGWRGLPLDVEYLGYCKRHLDDLVHQYLVDIPWYPAEKPLSISAAQAEARRVGIDFPASLDKRDVAANLWFETYKDKYPWVRALREYRSANTLLTRITTLWEGRNNGWFPFDLLYFGAGTTGRWSGGGVVLRRRFAKGDEEKAGKFNPQNMPRDTMFGVNLRYCFKAPDGMAFFIKDYSQIECRLLLWRAGDTAMLDMIKSGVHPYKAYAILNLGAPKDLAKGTPLYQLGKACVLGGGYQAGGSAFRRAARALAQLELTEEDAVEKIRQYRAANPKIVAYWARHQQYLNYSANAKDPTHEVELASGRVLRYFKPHSMGLNDWGRPQIGVEYTMGEEPDKIYGGLLTENEIQATARDVLRDGWVALDKASFDVPLTVHDEYVGLGPIVGAKDYSAAMDAVLAKSSPWAEGCPLAVDTVISEHYEK